MTQKWRKWLRTSRDVSIVNSTKIFSESHPANFWDILKREKKSAMTPFIWRHNCKIFIIEHHSPLLYLVLWVSHESQSKWGFPTSILPKKIVGSPYFKGNIDIAKDFFSFHRNAEIVYLNHGMWNCVNNLHFKIFFEHAEDCLSISLSSIHNKRKRVPQGMRKYILK